jgi:hypothetical protein
MNTIKKVDIQDQKFIDEFVAENDYDFEDWLHSVYEEDEIMERGIDNLKEIFDCREEFAFDWYDGTFYLEWLEKKYNIVECDDDDATKEIYYVYSSN